MPEAGEVEAQETEVQGLLMSHKVLAIGKPEMVSVPGMPKHLTLVLCMPEFLALVPCMSRASGTGSMHVRASGTGSMHVRASGTGYMRNRAVLSWSNQQPFNIYIYG